MKRTRWFLVAGLLVALLLAGVVSGFASTHPDGLDAVTRQGCTYSGEKVTGGDCMARNAKRHEVGGPLSNYAIPGIDNPYLATGLSGVLGVLVVFGLGAGLSALVRRRPTQETARAAGRHGGVPAGPDPVRRPDPGQRPDPAVRPDAPESAEPADGR